MDPRFGASPWTSLLLNTWRQVSEHLDIAACLDELTPGLIAGLPLRRVWVPGSRCAFAMRVAHPPAVAHRRRGAARHRAW